jgi:hypothetical protein
VSQTSGPTDHNQRVIDEFRANDGKVGGYFEGAPMILIHHVGARSGIERVNPLVYLPDGDDFVIAATKAREVSGTDRDELWNRLVEMRPGFAAYETKTTRTFPMFRLTRVS